LDGAGRSGIHAAELLLPGFLELIPPSDADFYLEICKNRTWHKGIDSATPTLLHGDLRRANIAYEDDKIVLFDWKFTARGPAACNGMHF
jgi:5-methylthioribose kinase